jgi:hypothetical protein
MPFYKVFGFFVGQCCGRPHDKVFGYLGLTNSRIQVDYYLVLIRSYPCRLHAVCRLHYRRPDFDQGANGDDADSSYCPEY